MRRYLRCFLPLIVAAPLLAQPGTGQIRGWVTRAGAPVASALIHIVSNSRGDAVDVRTGKDGAYRAVALLPGSYDVQASSSSVTAATQTIEVTSAFPVRADFRLDRLNGASGAAPARPSYINTETQLEADVIRERTVRALPSLGRDPYGFAILAGNASDAGLGTRGAGIAINGQRESSTDILLDGAGNNNNFAGSVGQPIPLDAVQELVTITSGLTAQYGRASGGVVAVVGKSGNNSLHGTAYEFNRSSSLATSTFQENAMRVSPQPFNRNQFGYSGGLPILKNRLWLFSSGEGLLVRSNRNNFAWIPSSQLIAQTAANTQAFFQGMGQLRTDASSVGSVSLNDLTAIYGRNPCTGLACATLPVGIPLFTHVAYSAPGDSGAGFAQNTWSTYNRVDYDLSEKTRLAARYAAYHEEDPAGVLSNSPYSNYDLGQTRFDNSILLTATRTWNPAWLTQTRAEYNRMDTFQQGLTSRGAVPSMYANPIAAILVGSDPVAFPGYNPFTPGSGSAFGGPENYFELGHDTTWAKGKHSFTFGGVYRYIRDDRTDAAYQSAVGSLSSGGGIGNAVNGLLSGRFAQIEVAVDPQGKFPCSGAAGSSCSLTLPLKAPVFTRSNRFGEGALHVEDRWSLTRRISLNLGLRWEHFGVQHNADTSLDSNWYATGVSSADDNLAAYLRNGGLQLASKSPVGQLWRPDWKDFAPRVGAAWDVFGSGRIVARAGFGIGYEREFGNVTFNVDQNLPNYAVIDIPGPISTNNFGPLANAGTIALPAAGARIINPDLKTASARFWNAAVQTAITRKVAYSVEYSGSKGINLYSIAYPNQAGFGNFILGDPCTGNGDCFSQPNSSYTDNVGYRGNQGSSDYTAVNSRLAVNGFLLSGLSVNVNYTWSHAKDNLSSTFFESGGQGVVGQFGNRNITVNNGLFDLGLLDPYHPNLDRGDADFDVRHRVTLAGTWQLRPWNRNGWIGTLLKGWSLSSVVVARSGQPFSVFDTNAQTLSVNSPRATFVGGFPTKRNDFVRADTPGTFHLFRFPPASIRSQPNLLTPGSSWPSNMTPRNAFRAPGFWNVDLGLHKDTRITERFLLQLRAESFNLLNHANLYIIGATADVGKSNVVDGCYGCTGSSSDRRQIQLAAKLIF